MTREQFDREFGAFLIHEGVYHFGARECCPVGTVSRGVTLQAPPRQFWPNAIRTLHRLERLRMEIRERVPKAILRINSGFRDPAYNAAVGGSSGSLHCMFAAFDVAPWVRSRSGIWERAMEPAEVFRLVDAFADSGQFGLGLYGTFVHVDTRGYLGDSGARWNG